MLNKIASSVQEAVGRIEDGSTILIGGFGTGGTPYALIDEVVRQSPRDITIVCTITPEAGTRASRRFCSQGA